MKYKKTWTQVLEEVLTEGLKPLDKSVIDAFYYRKEKAGKLVDTDGDTLTKNGMGGQQIAKWVGRKIKITAVSDVKSTESILKYMKKSIPSGLLEEVSEGWKAGKYTIKDDNGKILGTYSSGGKAQKAMNDLMQKGDYDKLEVAMVEEVEKKKVVEVEEGTVLDVKDVDKWIPEIKKGIDAPWVSVQKSTLGGDENVAIMIKLSLDPEKDWANKIYQNSRFAMVRLGANGEMEMFASERKLKNMRRTKFKSAKDVVQKINIWIKKVDEEVQYEEMNPADHVKKNEDSGMYCVYNAKGEKVKEFKEKSDAEKWAEDNHDSLMKEELVVEGDMLQAKMALGDANIKHKEHQGKIIINKKDKKKASDALMKSFAKKGTPPDLTIASGSFQEAQSKETDMDLNETIKQVVMGEAKVDLKKLKKEYDKNEDKNYHTENYLLLAKAFGTPAEVKKVQEIMKRNEKAGSTSKTDSDWMYKNINPYYSKLRNEEVQEKLEKESAGSFITAAAKAKKEGKKTFVMGGKEYPVTIKTKISSAYEESKVSETNKNDKSDDGDGLDAVQPKAVKKKFKDRKDKDIDNDGDTDNSDKFLHKKRKAISKAISKKDESKLYSFVKNMMSKRG